MLADMRWLDDIRTVWRELNTPDDFTDGRVLPGWYGELTNQLGHTFLGVASTLVLLCVWRELFGSMPYRGAVFGVVFVAYVIGIECYRQKWAPGDSWFDSVMFLAGATGALLPFYEVEPQGDLTLLLFNHRLLMGLFLVWAILLAVRVAKRLRENP